MSPLAQYLILAGALSFLALTPLLAALGVRPARQLLHSLTPRLGFTVFVFMMLAPLILGKAVGVLASGLAVLAGFATVAFGLWQGWDRIGRWWHAVSGALDRKWGAAAEAMGLLPTAEGFAGVARGFQVRAVRGAPGTAGAGEVKITVGHAIGSETLIPTQVTISRHGALDGPEQPTGDPAFDARFHLSGDEAAAAALLDAGTREALLRHAGELPFTLADGVVTLVLPDRLSDGPEVLAEAAGAALRLAEALDFQGREIGTALLKNARLDPLPAVRARNAEVLAGAPLRFPPLLSGLQGLLESGDPLVRFHAARGLGRDGFATLADLAGSPATPPEVAVRALEAALRPPGFPRQALAPLAQTLPLVRHALASPVRELRLAGLRVLAGLDEVAAAQGMPLDLVAADGTEAAVIAALGSGEEEQRAAIQALGDIGTVAAIAPLRALAAGKTFPYLWRSVEETVNRIRSRLPVPATAAPGQVALAGSDEGAGRVSIAGEDRAGRVALPEAGG